MKPANENIETINSTEAAKENSEILTSVETAKKIKVAPHTMMRMRKRGVGPPWFDLNEGTGKRVNPRYIKGLLLNWARKQSRR